MKFSYLLTIEIFFLILISTVAVNALCDINITNSSLPYTINQNDTYYCVNESLYIGGQTAITFSSGINNSTLDCLGYDIDSNYTLFSYGVESEDNNVIKNCDITDFDSGIYLMGVSNNTLINNTVSSNGYGITIYSSSNNTLINNTITNSKQFSITITFGSNNTLINNTITNKSISLSSTSNNTLINNTITNSGNGIILSSASNNTLINNTITSNSIGIYLQTASNDNNITGGSIALSSSYDYYVLGGSTTNYFRNTNFTTSREIRFASATDWFYYNNATANGIWLKTNVSSGTIITRELINWSQSLMQWNDSSFLVVTARYNITGLNPNKYYLVYNDSTVVYILKTDSSGGLNFTIYLSSEHEIKVEEDTKAPQYSGIAVSPTSPNVYSATQPYTFQSTWTDNVAVSDVILEFAGSNYSYLSGEISRSGNTYSKSFIGLAVGTRNYRWFANDTNNNRNSTSTYTYQVVSPATAPPPTYQPPENPTEFPETIVELPDLPPPGTPITLPPSGLTVKLEKNFVLTVYPITNRTAVVHNLSKIGEPGKYKILLCNQTVVSSYEINITVDLAYYCANYSGYSLEDPTVNIFRLKDNNWVPLVTGNIVKNLDKKIICGKIEATPYMITGFQPLPTSETAMSAIDEVNNLIDIAKRQNINVTEADTLLNQALYEYYSCNYITARALADRALNSLVRLRIPEWLVYLAFVLIAIIGIWYYKIVRGLRHQI